MSEVAVIERAEVVPTLDELAKTIKAGIRSSRGSIESGVAQAIEVGRQLTEARALVPRGEWMRWINSQIGVDYEVVGTYMQLYIYREVVGSAPNVISAQRLLSRAPQADVLSAVDPDDVRRLASAGWSARTIGAHLGISARSVGNILDPEREYQRVARIKRSKARLKAQIRAERTIKAERAGGGINAAFKQIRSSQIVLSSLSENGSTPHIRQAATLAYRAVCHAEDEIAKILADA